MKRMRNTTVRHATLDKYPGTFWTEVPHWDHQELSQWYFSSTSRKCSVQNISRQQLTLIDISVGHHLAGVRGGPRETSETANSHNLWHKPRGNHKGHTGGDGDKRRSPLVVRQNTASGLPDLSIYNFQYLINFYFSSIFHYQIFL